MTEHVSSKSFPSSSSPSKVSPSRPALGLSKQSRPKSKSLQPCLCTFQGCGKTFSKRSNLKAHLRVHTGALPYPCEFQGCQKRFRWKSSLKPHVKIHMKSGDVPRKRCSAFVYGLISSLSKELGPCNESEISGTEEDGANSQNPFIAAGGADNNAPEQNLDDDRIHPDFVSCNSSASVAGTQETSPMFSVARKPGRLNTANNGDAHSAPSPTSVTDLNVFDMPYACPEFAPTTDECMEPFSKGCVQRNAALSPTLHLIPAFLPQGMLHCGENMQSCARVLFQAPSSEEEDESGSSQGMPPFRSAQEFSHPMAQNVKQIGAAAEMDLHCNSVLSSSQCSSDTDMLSLTLDSMPVADVQGVGNPFWKGDTPLFDSLEVPFEEFADIDLLPEDAPVV